MEGLLGLLLFAAFFYLMMRFGCGAHMVHGHHGGHGDKQGGKPPATTDTDPVCGMKVPVDRGYAKLHAGRSYRFCSKNCLDKFDANPEKYIVATTTKEVP